MRCRARTARFGDSGVRFDTDIGRTTAGMDRINGVHGRQESWQSVTNARMSANELDRQVI